VPVQNIKIPLLASGFYYICLNQKRDFFRDSFWQERQNSNQKTSA
jgi:hypothetical protein